MVDWSDPASRARHIEAVGPARYNADQQAAVDASVVEVANGYAIRPVKTRFGRLMQVLGTDMAYQTLEQARRHAETLPKGNYAKAAPARRAAPTQGTPATRRKA